MERKNWAIVRLVSWSVAALALTVILLLGITGRIGYGTWFFNIGSVASGYRYADADKYKAGNGKIDGDAVQSLDVDWIDGDINIEVYDGDTVEFFEKSSADLDEEEQLHYYNKKGRLMIKYRKSARKSFVDNLEKELTIRVPKKTAKSLKEVNVDTISSWTNIKGISADKSVLDSASGDFDLADCQISDVRMDSTSGQMTGEALVIADKLVANTTSGDVQVSGSVGSINFDTVSGVLTLDSEICPKTVKTDSVSGNVTLKIPDNEGFAFEKDSVSGRVTCDFNISYEEDAGVYKNGKAQFDFESVSGDIIIEKR